MSIFFMLHLGMRLPHFGYKCRMNFIEILILFDRSSGSPSYRIWPPPAILASSCSDACTSMSPPPATLHSAFRRTHPKALISPPPATLRSPLSASPLSRMEPLPATLQSRLSTFSWVALISPDPATLKLILRASSCLSKFIVLLPAILISSLSALRGLLAINSPPPTALISFSSRELVFISHTVGWRLSP